ncbi:MAG: aspartate kinase [Marinilabiliales bacterium]|nr:MAG: aspartate kinase [Marinilabiliales bacterium]
MEKPDITVYKFGGASLKNAEALRNAVEILKNCAHSPLILVVSAIGKTTNALEKIHEARFNGDVKEAIARMAELENIHMNIVNELFQEKTHQIYSDLQASFAGLRNAIEMSPEPRFDESYDRIVGYGEEVASIIVAAYLKDSGLFVELADARKLIITDDNFRDAYVNWDLSKERILSFCNRVFEENPKTIVLTQGFISGTEDGRPTTLGREGSDFTASVFAFCTDAVEMHIWKDVQGILNADPKIMPEAEFLAHLSYRETVELAYYGASVIHPKTIKPLENKRIPLYVRSFLNPEQPGTCINQDMSDDREKASYIFKFNQILISVLPKDFSFINEKNLSDIFTVLSRNNIRVRMMQNSAVSFSFCCDNDVVKMPMLIKDLQMRFNVRYNENVELITIRHYSNAELKDVVRSRKILMEQKSRSTHQIIVKS